jgi:3-oxoacyl-[acyl-carrier-protein] synthase II
MKRVVVTGIGALTPIGNNLNDYWNNLKIGKSGAAPITKFDTSKFKTTFACELKGFDPKEHFDVKEIRKYDPFSQYALVAVDEAIKHGNINFDELNSKYKLYKAYVFFIKEH